MQILPIFVNLIIVRKILLVIILFTIIPITGFTVYFQPRQSYAIKEVYDPSNIGSLLNMLTYFEELLMNDQLNLVADIKGILGDYGLGAISPVMNKFLDGVGLTEILKDEIGGTIGLGGFLQGALKGVLDENDTVNLLLKQIGVKIPTGLFKKFKDIGFLNKEGLLGQISGGSQSCGVVTGDALGQIGQVIRRAGWDTDEGTLTNLIEKCWIDPQEVLKYYTPKAKPDIKFSPAPKLPNCQRDISGKCFRTSSSIPQGDNNSLDLNTDPAQLVLRFTTLILGVAGGIALLLIIIAGYKIIVGSGEPQKLQLAREQIIGAMTGLIFILLSYVIFQLIVVDVLKIPGICSSANDPNCAAPVFQNPERKQYEQKIAPRTQQGTGAKCEGPDCELPQAGGDQGQPQAEDTRQKCINECTDRNEQTKISCNNNIDAACEQQVNNYKKFDSGKCYREGIISCSKITDTAERKVCNTKVQDDCKEKASADKPPSKTDCVRDGAIKCAGNLPNCEDQCK